MLTDLYVALTSELAFSLAWKRVRHIRFGHTGGKRIDKLRSENHPHTDKDFIFTVNIVECEECGLMYQDCGLEFRKALVS